MMNFQKNLLAAVLSLCAPALFANDSTGTVSTGSIEYLKSKDIRMVSEDLYISTELIKVTYEFRNDTDHDLTETILFPLPLFPRKLTVISQTQRI